MIRGPALKAALFDIDGTLLDSRDFISDAFAHNFRLHNINAADARARWLDLAGQDLAVIYAHLCPGIDTAMLCETHRRFQVDNMHLVKMFPGIRGLLNKLQERGVLLAAVTSRSRVTVAQSLKLHLLHDFFDQIICAEDVAFIKPHPEPILTALRKSNLQAPTAVMIGDSRFDVQAGKAAGTRTIGVTYGLEGAAIASACPDVVVSSVEDLGRVLQKWLNE